MKEAPESVGRELAALSGRAVDDIDFSDIFATTEAEWTGAVRGRFYRPIKKQLTVRIDAAILEWLKQDGDAGYQKRLNDIVRNAML